MSNQGSSSLASLLTMDLSLGPVHTYTPSWSGQGFAPMALDLCIAMVSSSAPYRFKAPTGKEFSG